MNLKDPKASKGTCSRCKNGSWELRKVNGGDWKCPSCLQAEAEIERRAEEKRASAARMAEAEKMIEEFRNAPPRPPLPEFFCQANRDTVGHGARVPATCLLEGALYCDACAGERNPNVVIAKLAERVASLETTLALKPTSKKSAVAS